MSLLKKAGKMRQIIKGILAAPALTYPPQGCNKAFLRETNG